MAQSVNKQNPRLLEKKLADNKISLYLEYYIGREYTPKVSETGEPVYYTSGKMAGQRVYEIHHDRKKEALGLYLIAKPRTPEERQQNKDTRLLAEKIRYQREQEFLQDRKGYSLSIRQNVEIISAMENYSASYTKKDKRNIDQSINRFKLFLLESKPGCSHKVVKGGKELYTFNLSAGAFDKKLIEAYMEYLEAHSEGEGAASTFRRFKKISKALYDGGQIKTNPCEGLTIKRPKPELTKDVLTAEEITQLLNTHYLGENTDIQKAFVFSLFTGIRYCDVKEMKYENIKPNKKGVVCAIFKQLKTGNKAEIPLRDDILKLINSPKCTNPECKLFDLPSHTMCLKALRHWTARAGIDKHITWHCARHSFATNLLTNGANIKVVAELLGHSGLDQVDVYVKALEEQKKDAVNSLPSLSL